MTITKKLKIGLTVLGTLLILVLIYNYVDFCPNENNISKNIHRKSNSEFDRQLIEIAENIPAPDGKWYKDEFDGILIADCVNKDAINYYSKLFDTLKVDNDYTGISIEYGRFDYIAEVTHIKNDSIFYNTNYRNLIEVDLKISFSIYCGSLCGMWYSHKRRVIFNEKMEVIFVIGDDDDIGVGVS